MQKVDLTLSVKTKYCSFMLKISCSLERHRMSVGISACLNREVYFFQWTEKKVGSVFCASFRGCRLSRWPLSVAGDAFAYTLPEECVHMWPRPPLNVVWGIKSKCISGELTFKLRAVYWIGSSKMLVNVRCKQGHVLGFFDLMNTWY